MDSIQVMHQNILVRPFSSSFFGLAQRSAACDPLTAGWAMYETVYEEIKNEFGQGPLNIINANAKIDSWQAQISAATTEAGSLHGDAISNGEWNQALSSLKNQLQVTRNN